MTMICPNASIMSTKGKTTLFQIESHKSNYSVPKTITWSEIVLPNSWKLEKICPSKINSLNAEKIVEDINGNVEVIFNKSINVQQSLEVSTSNLKGIYISENHIPHGIYSDEPSFSDMDFKVNTCQFIPNREECSKEFMLPIYNEFRKWYFNNFSKKELLSFKEKYYQYLVSVGCNIPFVEWFQSSGVVQIFVSKESRTWETSDGKTITNKHHPVGNITYGNIEAASFVKIDKKVVVEDLSMVVKQNNYTH